MKYLLVLLVVGIGLWSLLSRLRGPDRDGSGGARRTRSVGKPVDMVECAHCGLHLAATDAISDASRHYCSDAHRRLGPAPKPPA